MNKKKNKGFTLIELLVVVAIIGILASVGVVAYSGYTESAKKGAVKSNHNSVKKWVQNELQKCNIGESKAMDDRLTCSGRTDAKIVTAIAESLGKSDDFKNPWDTTTRAITNSAAPTECSSTNRGKNWIEASSGIKITSCTYQKDGDDSNMLTVTVPTS